MTRLVVDMEYRDKSNPNVPMTQQKLKEVQQSFIDNPKYFTIYTDQDINRPIRTLWVFERVPIASQYFTWLKMLLQSLTGVFQLGFKRM